MFNFSGSEIVFLLLLALVVLGPERLPDAIRKFGQTYGEFKKMTTGFQSELKSALDEPLREMRETADAFKKAATLDVDLANPLKPQQAADPQTPVAESDTAAPPDTPTDGPPDRPAAGFQVVKTTGGPERDDGINFTSTGYQRAMQRQVANDAKVADADAEADAEAGGEVAVDRGSEPPLAPKPSGQAIAPQLADADEAHDGPEALGE